ncbi:EutN/CcmL family microcompartment protein [Thermocoleostomius sinensis]|jgi:carbon dioxide concentrating mechanism protein CcmL|uniref:Carboxysome shell vertex protein CcmL n=1 Tax=Thermocoleostomius sinensis A174 TaxID=2016057 RepID=A0A9E9C976_9CYAN|nr:EutN/CcmL family microcompartment protein [Thermocoleostomius sinensis]WAL62299.1 EutN/CcmL family microcompartment protein [Thermocoleostomius sinensis A174]
MKIARVCGTVVSTQKESSLTGVKFLVIQLIDEEGQPVPGYEVAADSVGAGVGEWVLVSYGSAARQSPGSESRPLDALVIGIIDTVSVDNQRLYNKREQDR